MTKRLLLVGLALAWTTATTSAQVVQTPYRTDWSGVRFEIPHRTTVCATIQASAFNYGRFNAQPAIKAAVDACPEGQVVQLGPGRFQMPDALQVLKSNITIRGAGPGVTVLEKSNSNATADPALINEREAVIGLGNRFPSTTESTSVNLTEDGLMGSRSITVANATGITVGSFVKIDADEWTTARWLPAAPYTALAGGTPFQIWGTDRIAYRIRQPELAGEGSNICPDTSPTSTCSSLDDYSRKYRMVAEIKEVAAVEGNVVTFTSPLHIDYPVAKASQLVRYTGVNVHVTGIGIEDSDAGRRVGRQPPGHDGREELGPEHRVRAGGRPLRRHGDRRVPVPAARLVHPPHEQPGPGRWRLPDQPARRRERGAD